MRVPNLTRRSALAGAVAVAAATPALAVAGDHPDAALYGLWRAYLDTLPQQVALRAERDRTSHGPDDLRHAEMQDLLDTHAAKQGDLLMAILGQDAHTVDGLAIKVRALAIVRDVLPEDGRGEALVHAYDDGADDVSVAVASLVRSIANMGPADV